MSGQREKVWCHIAFSTCPAFCKRALQNARPGETRIAQVEQPFIYRLFRHTRGEPAEMLGGPELRPFPYARAAAFWA